MKSKTKKLLKHASVIAVSALLAVAMGAGCGTTGTSHTHSYKWQTSDTEHWQYCEGCGDTTNKGEHVDADNDSKCDTCGKRITRAVTTWYLGTPAEGAATDGTSPETCADIQTFFSGSAMNNVIAGDTIKIMPGEHMLSEPITIGVSGTYDKFLKIEAYDSSQKTVLNFKAMEFLSTNRGVQINGSFIYWSNIDICGAGDNGMYIGGSYNIVENCEFYNNRDTGLQLGRSYSDYSDISQWPSYNLIKNCTSYNNYDNETYGENADGFAAKLTVGYGNVFDGCIAYRNSDDGWDLYGKPDSGNIGRVIMYNCVAFENGYLQYTKAECNEWFGDYYNSEYDEDNTLSYVTRDGDGNGFKLGGSTMQGDVLCYNCYSFNNRLHGVTDNSNPGVIELEGITSYNNAAIVDGRSHLNIKDESGKTQSSYYTIDGNGYILNSNGDKISDGNGGYVKAAAEGQTVNEEFGYIMDVNTAVNDDEEDTSSISRNIDVARTTDSYNAISCVLSVNGGGRELGSDKYRGSVEYSIFCDSARTYSYTIESLDASSYISGDTNESVQTNKQGTAITAITAASVFEALPANNMGLSTTIHKDYRNSDGSINMGDILKIKDYSVLFGNEHKIGADLSKSSWSDYSHYEFSDLSNGSNEDRSHAIATAIKDMLYVPVDVSSCYQDFSVVTKMNNATITWTSSDTSILSVGTEESVTYSNGTSVVVTVYRSDEGDKTATLTAKATFNDVTVEKSFSIVVKQRQVEVGEIQIESVTEEGYVIMHKGDTLGGEGGQPAITVTNAADYNGKLLNESDYTVKTTYRYATDAASTFKGSAYFSSYKAGVYEITKNITIGSYTKTFTYNVYIVDQDCNIDFIDDGGSSTRQVNVSYNGYIISGTLSNVEGYVYSMVADTAPNEATLKANGTCYAVTKASLSAAFEYDISTITTSGITVYYGVYNPNGKLTSAIYSDKISVTEISTEDAFKSLATSGGSTTTIYRLTKDLDFTGKTWTSSAEGKFGAVLDGAGHTVSGITTSASSTKGLASVFYRLDGGSVMNINFKNITLTGTGNGGQDVGIFGQAYSGYLADIRMTNITATGVQRVGGLVGHAYEQVGTALIIDNVSLINDDTCSIYGSTSRAGGILGFVQTNSTDSLKSKVVDIEISNCFVNATIGLKSAQQFGSIVGTYDSSSQAAYVNYSLQISKCYAVGTVIANNRAGGILGYQQGNGTLKITGCVSFCDIYHAGSESPIEASQKNASCIVGGFVSTADATVSGCFGKFTEYNSQYQVDTITADSLKTEEIWKRAGFDYSTDANGSSVWVFDATTSPYMTLR